MGLYEIFFPEIAEADHLRSIAESMRRQEWAKRRRSAPPDLGQDVGALCLVLLGLVGTLVEKGVITRDELLGHLRRVDALDGAADGKVSPEALRAALGFAPPDPGPPPAPLPRKRRSR